MWADFATQQPPKPRSNRTPFLNGHFVPTSNHNATTFIRPPQRLPKNPHNNLHSTFSPQPLQMLQPPHHKHFNLITTNTTVLHPHRHSRSEASRLWSAPSDAQHCPLGMLEKHEHHSPWQMLEFGTYCHVAWSARTCWGSFHVIWIALTLH